MTPGFSRLSVRGYRRLRKVDLALKSLNVLIGGNGVGKSSVLDIFGLLAASADGNLQRTIPELGGMQSLLTADGKTTVIGLQLRTGDSEKLGLGYDIRLASQGYGYVVADEVLEDVGNPPPSDPIRYIDSSEPRIGYWHSTV